METEIQQVMTKLLTYKEMEVLRLRFGIGYDAKYTLGEVGRIFRTTKERIRQIERRAMEKLKDKWHLFKLIDDGGEP